MFLPCGGALLSLCGGDRCATAKALFRRICESDVIKAVCTLHSSMRQRAQNPPSLRLGYSALAPLTAERQLFSLFSETMASGRILPKQRHSVTGECVVSATGGLCVSYSVVVPAARRLNRRSPVMQAYSQYSAASTFVAIRRR